MGVPRALPDECPHEHRVTSIEEDLKLMRGCLMEQGVRLTRIEAKLDAVLIPDAAVRLDRLEQGEQRRAGRAAVTFGAAMTGLVAGVGSALAAAWNALMHGGGR